MSIAYLTRRQVAERLQLSQGTLANWAAKGVGPQCVRLGSKAGARVRYPADAYYEWERAKNKKEA